MICPSLSPRQGTQKNSDLWVCSLPEKIKCGDTLLGFPTILTKVLTSRQVDFIN